MVALPPIPWRGILIGGATLLAGTITAVLVESDLLPALAAAVVLLILLAIDDRQRASQE